MIIIRFTIYKKNHVLRNYTYNDISNIPANTSIICFDNEFNFDNSLFDRFINGEFNKLIIISNQKEHKNYKNLYISKYMHKRFFKGIKGNLVIIINPASTYNEAKSIIKNLIRLRNFSKELNINLNIKLGNSKIYGIILKKETTFENDFITTLTALSEQTLEEIYRKIYDNVCNFLDYEFKKNNYCDFINNQCFANREKTSAHSAMGCCYSFKFSQNPFAKELLNNIKQCQYLNCNKCSIKSISCKLFTCNSLQKKGIKYDTHKILLLDCFFNNKQHLILSKNFFKTKEEIISKLLEKNYEPYFLYYIKGKYRI